MKILVINGCVRAEKSNTWKLTQAFLDSLNKSMELEIKILDLQKLGLNYLDKESLEFRDKLLENGELNHPIFDLAHEFANADKIIVSAPFWDLSLPAIVKVYIENICAMGITFDMTEKGMCGKCKADSMLYITTRGGIYGDNELEIASKYLSALCKMLGIDSFDCLYAEGLDIINLDSEKIMSDAYENAKEKAKNFI